MRVVQLVSTLSPAQQADKTARFAERSADLALPAPADSEWAERQVLTALWAQSTPLTLGQLHMKTGVPAAELQGIVTRLCMCGAARRLNTVIESVCASRRTTWLR